MLYFGFCDTQLSLYRQINLYDFIRLRNEECSCAYYHEAFLRGRPDLLDVSVTFLTYPISIFVFVLLNFWYPFFCTREEYKTQESKRWWQTGF